MTLLLSSHASKPNLSENYFFFYIFIQSDLENSFLILLKTKLYWEEFQTGDSGVANWGVESGIRGRISAREYYRQIWAVLRNLNIGTLHI
jgi:hypothetical protein